MKFLSRYEANAYFLLRIIFGFLFTCHGLQKVFGMIGLSASDAHPAMTEVAGAPSTVSAQEMR